MLNIKDLSCFKIAISLTVLLVYKTYHNYLKKDINLIFFSKIVVTEAFKTVFLAFLFLFNVFPIYYSLNN